MRQALAANSMLGDMDSGDGKTYLTDLELRNWGRLGSCSAVIGRTGIGTGKQKNSRSFVVAVVDFTDKLLTAVVVDYSGKLSWWQLLIDFSGKLLTEVVVDISGKLMSTVVVDFSGKLAWGQLLITWAYSRANSWRPSILHDA